MTIDASTQAVAGNIWRGMTASERLGVRFGMFPAAKMKEAETAGYDGRTLVLALLEIAKRKQEQEERTEARRELAAEARLERKSAAERGE